MFGKSFFRVTVIIAGAVVGSGQTSSELAAKYPVISAYEVRPGILMTAQYANDGQVCQVVLERRYSADQTDADSTIAGKLEDQLIDELAPTAERGSARGSWLNNSFAAGGVTHRERDFENILIEIDGTVSAGDKVVVIRWKKRPCANEKKQPNAKQ